MTDIKKSVVVCDLDGTLFDASHRDHLAKSGSWEEFHSASIHDKVHEDVARFIDHAGYFGNSRILYLTGCNEKFRPIKETLIKEAKLWKGELWMRPDNDWRPDIEVKPELLEKWMKRNNIEKDEIWCILEDRDKVVAKWREIGFNCWQVRAGSY